MLLIKTPSPQHVIDPDQRTLELPFTATGPETLEVDAPPTGVAAPPGYYYLVVNRKTDQGPVPSVARMVHVGTTSDPSEAPQPFPDDATAPAGGSATPDADTSQAATAKMQQLGEAAQSAPAPVAAPAVAATDVAGSAYRELSARPAAAAPADPSPLATIGAVVIFTSTLLTGRRRRRVWPVHGKTDGSVETMGFEPTCLQSRT